MFVHVRSKHKENLANGVRKMNLIQDFVRTTILSDTVCGWVGAVHLKIYKAIT